ncbi:hypothetical protein DXG01_003772 [Tephrocybe rancida]|nr:hypothetical protein DXG01_003772 [Tephrocybe rancida]
MLLNLSLAYAHPPQLHSVLASAYEADPWTRYIALEPDLVPAWHSFSPPSEGSVPHAKLPNAHSRSYTHLYWNPRARRQGYGRLGTDAGLTAGGYVRPPCTVHPASPWGGTALAMESKRTFGLTFSLFEVAASSSSATPTPTQSKPLLKDARVGVVEYERDPGAPKFSLNRGLPGIDARGILNVKERRRAAEKEKELNDPHLDLKTP